MICDQFSEAHKMRNRWNLYCLTKMQDSQYQASAAREIKPDDYSAKYLYFLEWIKCMYAAG